MQIENIDCFKKSSSDYALDRGSQFFELGLPQNQKDLLNNQAFQYANEELNKLKEIVLVAQKQALEIKKKVEITLLISKATYNFEPKVYEQYWLVKNKDLNKYILISLGPKDWTFGPPSYYEFINQVRYLPNGLWDVID